MHACIHSHECMHGCMYLCICEHIHMHTCIRLFFYACVCMPISTSLFLRTAILGKSFCGCARRCPRVEQSPGLQACSSSAWVGGVLWVVKSSLWVAEDWRIWPSWVAEGFVIVFMQHASVVAGACLWIMGRLSILRCASDQSGRSMLCSQRGSWKTHKTQARSSRNLQETSHVFEGMPQHHLNYKARCMRMIMCGCIYIFTWMHVVISNACWFVCFCHVYVFIPYTPLRLGFGGTGIEPGTTLALWPLQREEFLGQFPFRGPSCSLSCLACRLLRSSPAAHWVVYSWWFWIQMRA